ncbi:hypothetical protein [Cupriavidus sp. IDO]|nr:hypothetical protein [Cupriavidus sp. IDO]
MPTVTPSVISSSVSRLSIQSLAANEQQTDADPVRGKPRPSGILQDGEG